jgi:Tfp pilus assembly protein PilF
MFGCGRIDARPSRSSPGDVHMKVAEAANTPTSAPDTDRQADTLLARLAAGLVTLTFLIYFPAFTLHFVNYDDEAFVTNNPHVAGGVTWEGIKWAFTSAEIDYWRPASWISHMVDMELFGPVAGAHHLTNVLIHIGGTVMVLLALHTLTGSRWRSALVAALFAWHPLHVESVAWVAERKDVLCGFFWFFTLWAYGRYVQSPGRGRLFLVFTGFMLGVMSKPMVVTLPCVLLLLDFWPLNRITLPWHRPDAAAGWGPYLKRVAGLCWEKAPLFLVVSLVCLSTIYSQHRVGTMSTLDGTPFDMRLQNSLAAYATYIWQTVWPANLCVLYPIVAVPAWKWGVGAALLASGTLASLVWARQAPFLLTGWFWFLGVLVPVIGLMQVGEQAHADRYTYLPLVGVFIAVVWGAAHKVTASSARRWPLIWAATAMLVGCAVVTRLQLRHWENSVTLFERALAVTPTNITALNNLGAELRAIREHERAIPYLERALSIRPTQTVHFNLAWCYLDRGDYQRVFSHFTRGMDEDPKSKDATDVMQLIRDDIERRPDDMEVRRVLAIGYAAQADFAAAVRELDEVLQRTPRDFDVLLDRAIYLASAGKEIEATAELEKLISTDPAHAAARSNLAGLHARRGRIDDAKVQFQKAMELAPNDPEVRYNFSLLLTRIGQVTSARQELENNLRRSPQHVPTLLELGWLLATRAEIRDGKRAMQVAADGFNLTHRKTASCLDVLAAACAAAESFDHAVNFATEGVHLAVAEKNASLETALRERLELYLRRQPFTVTLTSQNTEHPPRPAQ